MNTSVEKIHLSNTLARTCDIVRKRVNNPAALIIYALQYLLYFLIATAVFTIFVPLTPNFPASGLDPSWSFALSEAVNKGLYFGKDIIFTLGPYANIYTHAYNSSTDVLILISSSFLALCYTLLLISLANKRNLFLLAIYAIGLITLFGRQEQFSMYSLLIALSIYSMITYKQNTKIVDYSIWRKNLIIVSFAPLALLAYVKGSYAINSVSTTVICLSFLLLKKENKLAIVCASIYCASLLLFWILAKQPIDQFLDYFTNLLPIISGYTEAMSLPGEWSHIAFFLLSAAYVLYLGFSDNQADTTSRMLVSLSLGVYLFLSFKGGFVRHDGHEIISGMAIISSAILAAVINKDPFSFKSITTIIIAMFSGILIIGHYTPFNKSLLLQKYHVLRQGIHVRLHNPQELNTHYNDALHNIRNQANIPTLEGKTDIYAYDVAALISTDNHWSPRPVIQSYAVYTPNLALYNLQHLQGNKSPDNIIFTLQAIDDHFPALEDGLSWPTIIVNYDKVALKNGLLYLKRNNANKPHDSIIESLLLTQHVRFNQEQPLPDSSKPLFAVIKLEPTLLGKITSMLFKLPQIHITLKLNNGNIQTYRLIAGMAEAGFIISPLVTNTDDFIALASNSSTLIKNQGVKSINIQSGFHKLFWKSKYETRLYTMKLYDYA